MLLLNSNGKPYMRSAMTLFHLNLCDLESQDHLDFKALYVAKGQT